MQEKQLRSGFTTGTCGAAAAKAAAVCLLSGERKSRIEMITPKGVTAHLTVEPVITEDGISFRVQKDAGDDPDVTNGVYVYGMVKKVDGAVAETWYQSEAFPHLYLTGGMGIGMVTRPGLSCPIGKHAINPVPRKMIFEAVEAICEQFDYDKELLIQIEIPDGVELAKKTFNPKLGIEGGISVLGTSGVVEPMSEQALLASIELEIHMKAVEGCKRLIITPGNYGEACLKERLNLSLEQAVKCSNFIGDTMEILAKEGIQEVLLVGHIGKLVKTAGGVRNTHSKYGDRRMEILETVFRETMDGREGLTEDDIEELAIQIRQSNTTEEALEYLKQAEGIDCVMEKVVERIFSYVNQWGEGKVHVEVVTFSSVYGILGKSRGADALMKRLTMEAT